ncbi:hypothetical protein Vadar_033962 [Vaccinium darrowii]|uniref:Uncharacterized protein n=1 Tax=Vaccinium darrowii TaxID=229202 RepID=A0ACB7YBN2_9ERIC|nr:hypothetical protein Vadar_033962 [Vaccinium darrowii]
METFYSWDHNVRTDKSNKDEEEEKQCSYAMELALSSLLPMVMKAAVELQVLDIIAKAGPGAQLSPSQIASRLPANTLVRNPNAAEMLDRMLRFLASHSILTCSILDLRFDDDTNSDPLVDRRLYGLAPVAKYFVSNQDGVSLAPLLCLIQDKVFNASWYELKGAVLEGGIPFDRVHGMHSFEYPGKDPRFNELFNKAMINQTTMFLNKILQSSYKGFEQVQKLVDVGGGLGVTLNMITSKYSHIKAINFDLPHVIKHAPHYPGVEHVEGDMLKAFPQEMPFS